jgi:hypothetical protein
MMPLYIDDDEKKIDCLLVCWAVQSDRSLPTFQRLLLPPSPGRSTRLPGTVSSPLTFTLAAVRTKNLTEKREVLKHSRLQELTELVA